MKRQPVDQWPFIIFRFGEFEFLFERGNKYGFAIAIKCIACQWVAYMAGMQPDLVCSASMKLKTNHGVMFIRLHHFIGG